MVADRDEIAGGEAFAETSGGVGEEDRRCPGKGGRPDAEHDLVEVPTLIRMDPPCEEQNCAVADRYREEAPAMADDPWLGEEGDLGVRDLDRIVEGLGVVAQARSENDGSLMAFPSRTLGDRCCGFLQLFVAHLTSPRIRGRGVCGSSDRIQAVSSTGRHAVSWSSVL